MKPIANELQSGITRRTGADAGSVSEAMDIVERAGSAFDFVVTASGNACGKLHPSQTLGPLCAAEVTQEAGGRFFGDSWATGWPSEPILPQRLGIRRTSH